MSGTKLVMDVWDMSKEGAKITIEKNFPSQSFFLLKDGSESFFTNEQENCLHFYSKDGHLKWKRTIEGRQPSILESGIELIFKILDVIQNTLNKQPCIWGCSWGWR